MERSGIVSYVRSLDLIRAYQTAVKNFCEDINQSTRNDESTLDFNENFNEKKFKELAKDPKARIGNRESG